MKCFILSIRYIRRTAYGETTGQKYHIAGEANRQDNLLVGWYVTLNPNGEITVFVDNVRIERNFRTIRITVCQSLRYLARVQLLRRLNYCH